ncbi:hypothetical protein P154DRAFT_164410 [Amniculicola lignicola CBS 123094]|uniref:Mg2+ transporter protein, CorA-like/Zinc transport protein ZntB n=1 Tax=Amniculicola lignicola CBS 123094 TaxID=1392246 RepID=A0A6A5WL65_9PLEO|nr:hypothetical protein P154DRAFT_164410 [Amniculicola lignicola CBS 123094]
MATTYNTLTGRTIALVENFTEDDLEKVSKHLLAGRTHISHPLFFPEMMLHMIMKGLNDKVRIPEELAFFLEERRTGLGRVKGSKKEQRVMREWEANGRTIWDWGDEEFRQATTRVNRFKTTVAYLERRFGFAKQLSVRLLEGLEELSNCGFGEGEEKGGDAKSGRGKLHEQIEQLKWMFKERIRNRQLLLENYEMQMHCMQKRTENLITVLYTVLSQIDTKNQVSMAQTNLQIAQAVRSDSIPMRTIAYVTLIFLPGAFIATIFGTNFFALDPKTGALITAPSFWYFWAIAIPLTIFILLVWNYWVYCERKEAEELARVVKNTAAVSMDQPIGQTGNDLVLGDTRERNGKLGWLMKRLGSSEVRSHEMLEGQKVEV